MKKPDRILLRVMQGISDSSIPFYDLRALLRRLGFDERIRGSHHIFTHPDIAGLLNLQESNGEAKPYQIRQFLRLAERYNLRMGDEQ